MEEKKLLFEQLKSIKEYWVEVSTQALKDTDHLIWSENQKEYKLLQESLKDEESKEAYQKVINEVLEGAIHSILVMIDGGDSLADNYTLDLIVEDENKSFKEEGALHEDFFAYLEGIEDY